MAGGQLPWEATSKLRPEGKEPASLGGREAGSLGGEHGRRQDPTREPVAAQPAASGSSWVSAQIPALPFLQMSSEMPLPQEGFPDPWAQPTYTLRTCESGQAAATPSTDRSGEVEGLPCHPQPSPTPSTERSWDSPERQLQEQEGRHGDTTTHVSTSADMGWPEASGSACSSCHFKGSKPVPAQAPRLPLLGRAETPVPL